MHIISLLNPIVNNRWNLASGDWLCEDLTAAEIARAAERGTFRMMYRPVGLKIYANDCRVLLISNGGYGDMLLLTPALRALKLARPHIELALCAPKRVHCVFDGLPYAPRLIDYPMPSRDAEGFDQVLTFEHLQEQSEEGRVSPAVTIKSRVLGVGPLEGDARRVEYLVTPEEEKWASTTYYRRSKIARIGIQVQASSPTRSYHLTRLGEVVQKLYALGHEIYLFAPPGGIPEKMVKFEWRGRIKNLSDQNLSFRQSAAVAKTCDVVFCPDSSFAHLAGALSIPAVAIFASTDHRMRTADYSTVISLQSNVGCDRAACWHHPKDEEIWVKGAICEKLRQCVPLNSITPELIVDKIQKQLAKS